MSRIPPPEFRPTAMIVAALVLAAAWGFAAAPAAAQDSTRDWNQTADPLQGGIGLHYGQVGGHGLAFRVPVRWWLYAQVAGGVWHTGEKKQHNLGFNLNYLLRQDQRLRLFISAGFGYFYRDELVDSGTGTWDKDTNWNVGGGVGLEYLQGSRWAWKVEADFAHLGKSGDIKVIPQAGITYYW